jgi:hypothetical protein
VDWKLTEEEAADFETWILGPLFQMTSLMLYEERGHLTHLNAIGEQFGCAAQLTDGTGAHARDATALRFARQVMIERDRPEEIRDGDA